MSYKEALQFINDAIQNGFKVAIIYCRVSTSKQADDGDSWEDQEKACQLAAQRQGYFVVRVFYEPYTGTKEERPVWTELLQFCKQLQGKVHAVFVRDLDRFNRGGVLNHLVLKQQLSQYHVELKDTAGIVQGTQNTLDHLGFEYQWSNYSSSEIAELVKSQTDKDEVRKILTRLIGAEITLTQKGYWMRSAPHGFMTAKTEDHEGKRRAILVSDPESSQWYIKMYEMRSSGIYTDKQITKKINQMGFTTPTRKRRDPITRQVIKLTGGKPLSEAELQRRIARPIYAGIISEKWTDNKPVKAQFDGLISIELWNKAQKGKQKIINIGDDYKIVEGENPTKKRLSYTHANPLFPYKSLVKCPICHSPLMGSASTGKNGKRFPAYHCDRKHKRFAVKPKDIEEALNKVFQNLTLSSKYINLFGHIILLTWKESQKKFEEEQIHLSKNIEQLTAEKQTLIDKIKKLSSDVVIAELEKEIEMIESKIIEASEPQSEYQIQESEILSLIEYAKYFLEHLYDFFLQSQKSEYFEPLFKLIFKEIPTYEDLKSGTPKTRHYIAVSQGLKIDKSRLVALELQNWKDLIDDLQNIKSFLDMVMKEGSIVSIRIIN